jgi:hypothetical protein
MTSLSNASCAFETGASVPIFQATAVKAMKALSRQFAATVSNLFFSIKKDKYSRLIIDVSKLNYIRYCSNVSYYLCSDL